MIVRSSVGNGRSLIGHTPKKMDPVIKLSTITASLQNRINPVFKLLMVKYPRVQTHEMRTYTGRANSLR